VIRKRFFLAALSAVIAGCGVFAVAQEQVSSSSEPAPARPRPSPAGSASPASTEAASAKASGGGASVEGYSETAMRIEGEKRFRTNCGRCHMAPHKFPPRTMATIVRHMRVRALITDEDMKLILRYMTQ
jgi:mono/diheme cytochrome c family protein